MNWLNIKKNQYPSILLSDCKIDCIELKKKDIYIYFNETGFIIRNDLDNNTYHSSPSQLIIKKANLDDITIKVERSINIMSLFSLKYIRDINLNELINKINSKVWFVEFVEEFYSCMGAYYIVFIHSNNKKKKGKKYWGYINIRYVELIYMWDNILYNWPAY